MAAPPVGTIDGGYVFKGGDPSNAQNWVPSSISDGGTVLGMNVPGFVARPVEGIGRGMMNVVRHAGNLIGAVSDDDLARAAQLDAPLMSTTGGKIGNFIGETLPLAAAGGGLTAGMGAMGGVGARIAGNAVLNGALQGAGQGYLMGDPGNKLVSAAVGGVAGGAIPAAMGAGKKLAQGLSRTPAAQTLLDAGVDLTPGMMDPKGSANLAETVAEKIPFVGPATVGGARDNAVQSWRQAMAQQAAAPGAQIAPGATNEMVDQAIQSYKPLYDQAKGFPILPTIMQDGAPNVPLSSALKSAVNSSGVSDEARSSSTRIINNLASRIPKAADGTVDSSEYIAFRSALRDEAAKQGADTLGKDRFRILNAAQKKITDLLNSQLPPDAQAALNTADTNIRNAYVLKDALLKHDLGNFTPHQVLAANADRLSGTQIMQGGDAQRKLAQAALEVFTPPVPLTGARNAGLLALTGAAIAAPKVTLPIAGGYLGLLGSRTGRAFAAGQTAPQQYAQQLAALIASHANPAALEAASQLIQRGGTQAGIGLVNPALPAIR